LTGRWLLSKPLPGAYDESKGVTTVLKSRHRRKLAVVLVILGGVLMFFAPDKYWVGGVLLALGVVLELVGITLEKKSS